MDRREQQGGTLAPLPGGPSVTMTGASAPTELAPGSQSGARGHGDSLAPGQRIGRYELVERRGEGGMGVVFRARDPDLDRDVAIKVLRAGDGTGPDSPAADDSAPRQRRLLREAQAMARLRHDNLVTVYDVGTMGRLVFIAMEYVHGQTLRQWLAAAPRTWRDIVRLFVAAGRGLSAAHQAGVVHRDFKPDNVLVGDDGHVQVVDFGLAGPIGDDDGDAPEVADATATAPAPGAPESRGGPTTAGGFSERLTHTGAVLGTPAYMAPEQHQGRTASAHTDQFSYAVALYEALYRRRPFGGDTYAQIMASVLSGAPEPPPPRSDVPAAIGGVLMRALSLDPAGRFPSIDDLVAQLERVSHRGRRQRRILALGAVAMVLGAGGSLYLSRAPGNQPAAPPPGPETTAASGARGDDGDVRGDRGDRDGHGDDGDDRGEVAQALDLARGFLDDESTRRYLDAAERRALRKWSRSEQPGDGPATPDPPALPDIGALVEGAVGTRLYAALPRITAAHQRSLQRCARLDERDRDPGDAPASPLNFVLEVTVTPSGRVSDASVEETGSGSARASLCVLDVVRHWRFPRTGTARPVTIHLPIHVAEPPGR